MEGNNKIGLFPYASNDRDDDDEICKLHRPNYAFLKHKYILGVVYIASYP